VGGTGQLLTVEDARKLLQHHEGKGILRCGWDRYGRSNCTETDMMTIDPYIHAMVGRSEGRRLFRIEQKRDFLVSDPKRLYSGDQVTNHPDTLHKFVLRPVPQSLRYSLVGDCYVYGVSTMGELMEQFGSRGQD